MSFAYTVRTTLERREALEAWVAWLLGEHVAHVCAAGARDGEVIVVDGGKTVEVRYRFASREAFATYEREHAPRLREDGLAFLRRLGLEPGAGVTFARETGDVAGRVMR